MIGVALDHRGNSNLFLYDPRPTLRNMLNSKMSLELGEFDRYDSGGYG